MSLFVLIGGKANKEILTNRIEKAIVALANKENPVLLYCPFASNDIEKSILRFNNLMKGINCNIINIRLNELDKFEEYLKQADILYIGGGCCDDLVKFFKDNKLDKILLKYIDEDKIFAGSSAGAMLYCTSAMGDKYVYVDNFKSYNFKMLDCLGILNINICPHYQNEDLIVYNDEIKNYDMDAFGIEEDTALIIDGNKYYVVKETKNTSLYHFDRKTKIMKPLYEGVVYEKDSSFRS
ncbi:MAG: Type 1 glutamine amidotransferase-like domain-containing protein [Acholeplasmatales bacterium]|nr:Type 1 glutamine amidotransferase-like domain-containing protein [Acholeplasmatales bacterium]